MLGVKVLGNHDIPAEGYWYWLGTGVLLGMAILFNIIFTVALAHIKGMSSPHLIQELTGTFFLADLLTSRC